MSGVDTKVCIVSCLIALVCLVGVSGCKLLDWVGYNKPDDPEEIPEAPIVIEDPEPEEPSVPGTGSDIFLWKPLSESTGNGVVLLPSWMRPSKLTMIKVNNRVDAITPQTVNTIAGTSDDYIWANGDRIHLFLNEPGASYGTNVHISITYNGATNAASIGNGANRFELRWNK